LDDIGLAPDQSLTLVRSYSLSRVIPRPIHHTTQVQPTVRIPYEFGLAIIPA